MVSRAPVRKQDPGQDRPAWGFPGLAALPLRAVWAILTATPVGGSALLILGLLLLGADCTGFVSVKYKDLARVSKLDTDTVKKHVRQLRQVGELRLIEPGSGKRKSKWQIARVISDREGGEA